MSQKNFLPQPLLPNHVYHIFSHAITNNNLFDTHENYMYFLNKWDYFSKNDFRTYAFCLMPNHFHLCIQTLQSSNFNINSQSKTSKNIHYHSKIINSFLSSYTQSFNKYRNSKGALFRSVFGRVKVENFAHMTDLICYIHHNPIHHFQTEHYYEWAYSSYNSYKHSNDWPFLNTDSLINRVGNIKNLLDYHELYRLQKRFASIENTVNDFYLKYK